MLIRDGSYKLMRVSDIPTMIEENKVISLFTEINEYSPYIPQLNIMIQLYSRVKDKNVNDTVFHLIYRYICEIKNIQYHVEQSLDILRDEIRNHIPDFDYLFNLYQQTSMRHLTDYLKINNPFSLPSTEDIESFKSSILNLVR
ncbi:Uncharacterised protein [uncultured archaeon]|nr:Uncharacterised protein [uncultured archaeon]